jgi:ribosomal protein S18 acetylase RimI-like enzyme
MTPQIAQTESRPPRREAAPSATATPLTGEHRDEVLAFLAGRPLHTVILAGFIRDNGLVSPLNRGEFYACRDENGGLEGVALIGHATIVEARTEAAMAAFARLARERGSGHVILGEREKVGQFWDYYAAGQDSPRLLCREMLLEQRWPVAVREEVKGLRLATPDDLELVMPVQAEMAFEESGVNPLERDPEGFRRRCARRIEKGRVWVWVAEGRLIFKAEIISETPEVIYLEGVWVDPRERGKGYGLRCMAQMGRELLRRAGSLSMLVNERNQKALSLYRRAGYKLRGCYDTIFLQPRDN